MAEQSILSEAASIELANGILKLAEQIANKKLEQQQKRWLTQTEVRKLYRCTHSDVTEWERLGLTKRKQGRSYYYDRQEIERFLESQKY
ncbi:helix-turn-helix domain-containing protein [Staphylococcus hominis]|uniref:helix-turn-helix domain-containing protein n=1 Tax=Staphylococcus hominis TaxID=1290 RepID=UPI001D13A038|nr:helix-turn-helix domain-containing protein [Staphylococcus hominis]MCC3737439.1 DNA-binding protein [Staphylococcus hominis]